MEDPQPQQKEEPTPEPAEMAPDAEQMAEQADAIKAQLNHTRQQIQESVQALRAELAKIDAQEAKEKAKHWVEDNPALAIGLAVGVGILLGKTLSAIGTQAPPPMKVRLRKHANLAADQARKLAEEVGHVVVQQAIETGSELVEGIVKSGNTLGNQARHWGDEFSKRSEQLSDRVIQQAKDLGETIAHRTAATSGLAADSTEDIAEAIQDRLEEASLSGKGEMDRAGHMMDMVFNTLRTAFIAIVIRKVAQWFRALAD